MLWDCLMKRTNTHFSTRVLGLVAAVATTAVLLGADNGDQPMNARVIATHYGPFLRINDWRVASGKGEIHSPGGTVQILTDGTVDVMRDEYPLPGGGDVELELCFNFERANENSAATLYFNKGRKDAGFRVRIDGAGVQVFHKDTSVYTGAPVSLDRKNIHKVKLVTLAWNYAVFLNGTRLAGGEMATPCTENEGRLGVIVDNAAIRITASEERFIKHDTEFPEWKRAELLYEE